MTTKIGNSALETKFKFFENMHLAELETKINAWLKSSPNVYITDQQMQVRNEHQVVVMVVYAELVVPDVL